MISIEEIKEKQEELSKMIEEYQNKKDLISTWDKNWKPESAERFYFVNNYKIVDFGDYAKNSIDEVLIYNNRIFQTYDLAEKWLEIDTYLREKSFEPDWNDSSQEKWSLYFDYYNHCAYSHFEPFYFESAEIIDEILKKYTTEELKFYFNIGE